MAADRPGLRVRRPAAALLAAAGLGLLALAGPAAGHDPGDEPAAQDVAPPALDPSADYDYAPPAPGSYRLPPIGPAAGGALLESDGRALELAELLGERVTLLSLIYTRCADPDGCPLATAVLYEIQDESLRDPALAEGVQLVSLSFDPGHDTPEVMAGYAAAAALPGGTPWRFLTAPDEAALAPVLEAYGQAVGEKRDPDDDFGPLTHQLRVYLIDRERRIRNIYSLGFLDPRLVLADLRTLLLEQDGPGPAGASGPGG